MFLFCMMFDIDDTTYLFLLGMLSKKSYIYKVPRSSLDEIAEKYNVTNPKQFKTKKSLILFLLRLWKEYFEQHLDFYNDYQERYGEFSLESDSQEEKDEEKQILDYQELCKRKIE